MIIPNIKNLIKDDFSDFTAYQGAVVTKNKTFPIDVFKGGRNLWVAKATLNSYTPYNTIPQRLSQFAFKSQSSSNNTLWAIGNTGANSIQFERESGEYFVSMKISKNGRALLPEEIGASLNTQLHIGSVPTTYDPITRILKTSFKTGDRDSVWLIHSRFGNVKTVDDYLEVEDVTIKRASDYLFSPSPIDGYGYTGSDGAYHIQTSGGTHTVKYLNNQAKAPFGSTVNYRAKLYSFNNNLGMDFSRTTVRRVDIEENKLVEFDALGTQVYEQNQTAQWNFLTREVDQDLDFIASEPTIYDETSINSMNILDIVQLPEISKEDKQLTILSTDEVIIDDFISFNMSTKGSLYQRNMKYCEVVLSGKYELTSKWINIKRFIASDLVDNGNLQEIDYGDFGVLKSEYDDTTQRTKLTCYDRMLQAQIPYDSEVMNLTYPMTVSQVLNRLAIVCKLDLVVNTVNNLYQVIHSDLWANQSFTYADVLDHIAQATTSIISIRNNKLEIFNPIENDFTIQGKFYSLKIGESYGKTNIVNVSQEPQHYNKFAPSNALDIPLEDRKELAFSNNPILNQDMQTWADRLYLQTKDLEYATFESSTIGYGIFEVGDMVDVYEAGEDVIHRVMITNETFDFKHALTTEIGSNLPMVHKNQYVVETDQVRQGQTTYLIVDQLNGVIEALVQKVDDEADKTAQLTIRIDEIDLKVSNISNGNIIGNFNPENYLGWEGGSRLLYVAEYSKLRYLSGLTYAMGFQPVKFPQSLSEWGLSFFNNGSATSPFGYVVPTENYSYKAKVQRFKPFSIDLLEFKDMLTPFHKSTRFTFNAPQSYVQFTSALDPETVFVRIKFNVTGVTPNDRLEITENMYNRGLPKEYFVSGTEALVYAQSNINILDNKIGLVVDEVKVVDNKTEINKGSIEVMGGQVNLNAQSINSVSNDIHNAGVEINAIDGVSTYGKKFEVMSEDRSTSYMKVTDDGVESHKMTAVDMIATNATIESGKIAGFDISGNNLVGDSVSLKPNEVSLGSSTLRGAIGGSLDNSYLQIKTPNGSVGGLYLDDNKIIQKVGTSVRGEFDYIFSSGNGGLIGSQSNRYGTIYLQNQPDVASDTRYKNDIQDIDPFLLEMIAKYVIPKRYETQFDDKLHFGYIAQDVEMALYQYFYQSSVLNGMNKLEASRFANTQIAQFAFLSKSDSYMSLLYGELAVIMDAYNRSRIDELEERLTKLELML